MAKLSVLVLTCLVVVAAVAEAERAGRTILEHAIQVDNLGLAEIPRSRRHLVLNYLPSSYLGYSENFRAPVVASECRTHATGEPGICKPLSECYPVLYTRAEEQGVRNLTNIDLAEDLMETSGICQGGEAENIICCKQDQEFAQLNRLHPELEMNPLRIPDCFTRVVGGTPAKAGTFPWMAALMQSGKQFCGGSLIDNRHILTAAHCVQHMTANHLARFQIYLGARNVRAASEPNRQVYSVANIWYHRGFSMQHLHHDVAILRLATEVKKFNEYIQPICLSTGTPPYDSGKDTATLSGWGRTKDGGLQSPDLLQVDFRVWTNQECMAKYGNKPPAGISSGMVCAGKPGKDACQGDSGGPLIRESPVNAAKKEQIGIVSWGIGCGEYPGVYTRVDRYRDWIDMVRAKF